MTPVAMLGTVLMGTGTVFSLLAAWGILDFPSPLARMHAATKSASLGLALLAIGAGAAAESWALTGVGFLVAVFMFVTAPISGHMVGRAAYLAGQVDTLVHDDLAGVDSEPLRIGRPERSVRRPLRWAALVLIWMILWRDLAFGTLIGGMLVATLIEGLRKSFAADTRASLVGLIMFMVRYVGMVVTSNLRVGWEVITPRNDRIREAIVAVPLQVGSLNAALLVANAVSFTPGSLAVELTEEPITLYVHVLHYSSTADVVDTVRDLERLAAGVFPDRKSGATRNGGRASGRPPFMSR